MGDSISFGQYLKKLRKEQKITLHELGRRVGITHSYISQIENGKKGIPSPHLIKSFSDELGVPYFDLLLEAGYIDEEIYEVNQLNRNLVKRHFSQSFPNSNTHSNMLLLEQLINYYQRNKKNELFQIGNEHGRSILDFMNSELCLDYNETIIETFDALSNFINTYDFSETLMQRNLLVESVVNSTLEVIGLDILYNWSIEDFVKLKFSKLNQQTLSDDDRSRILDMLKLMFPQPL